MTDIGNFNSTDTPRVEEIIAGYYCIFVLLDSLCTLNLVIVLSAYEHNCISAVLCLTHSMGR